MTMFDEIKDFNWKLSKGLVGESDAISFLEELGRDIDRGRTGLCENAGTIEALEKEVEELQEEVKSLEDENSDLISKLDHLEDDMDDLTRESVKLAAEVEEKSELIYSQERTIEHLKGV